MNGEGGGGGARGEEGNGIGDGRSEKQNDHARSLETVIAINLLHSSCWRKAVLVLYI